MERKRVKILVIDNYDSFTYNLVQYLGELGAKLLVYRNDKITLEGIRKINPQGIVISPGPGRPEDAGISNQTIKEFARSKPILGVCLGHQCIGYVFGAKIVSAKQLMHGKTSWIYHTKEGIFSGLPNPFEATRYHSLVIERKSIPAELKVIAWTEKYGEIMGIRHKIYPVWGVQFHPESILTKVGKDLLLNFLKILC